jgi:uncharacterized protein YjiS (DUF1127 family)
MNRTSCGSDIDSSVGFASAKQALVTAAAWPSRVLRVLRERRQLAMMDQSMLKDIGLSKADAYREWSRAFWDLPDEAEDPARHAIRRETCRD